MTGPLFQVVERREPVSDVRLSWTEIQRVICQLQTKVASDQAQRLAIAPNDPELQQRIKNGIRVLTRITGDDGVTNVYEDVGHLQQKDLPKKVSSIFSSNAACFKQAFNFEPQKNSKYL